MRLLLWALVEVQREQVIAEHLYPKLLALLRALKAFLGGLSSEFGDCFRILWQLLWPRIADAIISLHLSKVQDNAVHCSTLQHTTE